jgi:hypothetical protein
VCCSGAGFGAQQTLSRNGIQLRLDFAVMDCQTHYWALRQQARHLFVPSVGNRRWVDLKCWVGFRRGSLVVVASLWWWGVVFDLWIVVASIWHAWWSPPLGVVGFCVC